jgi:hypothetical protein
MTEELRKVFSTLPPGFFGTVEVSYQNGNPGVVKITQTHKLSSRDNRGENHDHLNK